MTLESNLINIVLVDTIHPGNIGSVARAMKTMGLKRLSLVNPRIFPSDDAVALSGNATDVLKNATVYKSIKEAIKESTFVYATSARDRSIQWPIMNAEQAANDICNEVNSKKEVSIIFGKEDRGLTNDELELANKLIDKFNDKYNGLNQRQKNILREYINNVTNTFYFTRRATGYPGPGIIPSPPRNMYLTLQIRI